MSEQPLVVAPGREGLLDGRPLRGPDGRACRLPAPPGRGAAECGPGDPDGEKPCFKLAELPGLLMKSRVSMASCSRTFLCGE